MSQALPGPAGAITSTWKGHYSKGYPVGCSSKVAACSSREVILSSSLTLVRPHLECCDHFWIPTEHNTLTYQAEALIVLMKSWENWCVHPQEEKAKSLYSCLQAANRYGWKGPLLYSDMHSERQHLLAGKWEIHNSVGSRKKHLSWKWSNTGAGVQKAYGISTL